MLVGVEEDGDKAKAEQAAADKAKEKDLKEAQEGRSEAAAKAGDRSEKTSILEPMAYERRSNYNTPFMRTTFYGQKEPEQLVQEKDDMQAFYNERDGLWMLTQLE